MPKEYLHLPTAFSRTSLYGKYSTPAGPLSKDRLTSAGFLLIYQRLKNQQNWVRR